MHEWLSLLFLSVLVYTPHFAVEACRDDFSE
jgi:hypothetical protein